MWKKNLKILSHDTVYYELTMDLTPPRDSNANPSVIKHRI